MKQPFRRPVWSEGDRRVVAGSGPSECGLEATANGGNAAHISPSSRERPFRFVKPPHDARFSAGGRRPRAAGRVFQSGRSQQQPTGRKLPFVTPRPCGRLSGRFEVGPASERRTAPVSHRPIADIRWSLRLGIRMAAVARTGPFAKSCPDAWSSAKPVRHILFHNQASSDFGFMPRDSARRLQRPVACCGLIGQTWLSYSLSLRDYKQQGATTVLTDSSWRSRRRREGFVRLQIPPNHEMAYSS